MRADGSIGYRAEPWLYFAHDRRMPLLRSKIAMSLDGRTALSNGASQWITGAPARRDAITGVPVPAPC